MDLFKRIQDLSAIYDDDGPSSTVLESRPMFNDGGMLVQPSDDGSRPGYKGETEKETLKNFIDNYKKKNKTNTIDTTILARKVEDLFKVENGPKKLASLRKHNPDIFKETKIVYGIKGQGPWNDAWKNNPEFRKFFKKKIQALNGKT